MKFSVLVGDLVECTKDLVTLCNKKGGATSHLLLVAEKDSNQLMVRGTDLQTTEIQRILAEVSEEGSIGVPAKLFYDALKNLAKDERVKFEVVQLSSGKFLRFKIDRATFKVPTLEPSEFPEKPNITNPMAVQVSTELLRKALEKTVYAVSKEVYREALTGVKMAISDKGMTVVGTDGYRLAEFKIAKDFNGSKIDVVIPERGVRQILKKIKGDGSVELKVGDSQLCLQIDSGELYIRLIEGAYPNYEQTIPTQINHSITLDRDAFYASIKRLSVFHSKSVKKDVRLIFEDQKVLVKVIGDENEGQEELGCDFYGEKLQVLVNSGFLKDTLSAIETPNVILKVEQNNRPLIFMPADLENGESYLTMIMPFRSDD